jgi:hypothetical protein
MPKRRSQSGATALETCVQLLQNLQHEIQTSVGALSRNNLREFELSLWRQEMVCSNLRRLLASGDILAADGKSVSTFNDAAIELKLQADVFARLVERCRRSTAILQDLCSLYGNASRGVFGTKLNAFNCEG